MPPAPSEVASPRSLQVISVQDGDTAHGESGTHETLALASVGRLSEP